MKAQTIAVLRHAGTHLIKPLVKVMTGRGSAGGKGENTLTMDIQGKLVVFTRDPRNRVISAYRWKQTEKLVTPGDQFDYHDQKIAEMIVRRKKNGGMTQMEFMHAWADRWMNEPARHHVTFEKLTDPEYGFDFTLEIGEFLLGPSEGDEVWDAAKFAYDEVVGKVTFTGRHSNWHEWFGPATRRAWHKAEGDKLLEKMGYE